MNAVKHKYVPTLDGWRAIAILGVVVCHGSDAIFSRKGMYPNNWLYGLTRHGSLGVDVFFGISGLLICGRLLEEEQQRGRISAPSFYIRRAFRILPPALTYLAAVGLFSMMGLIAVSRWEWLSCVFLFRNYVSAGPSGWYTGQFWSLAVEEHFYLIFPSILLFFGSRRARWLVVALALTVAAWRSLDFHEHWLWTAMPGASFYERTDIRFAALLWGCWMALLMGEPVWRTRLEQWLGGAVRFALLGAFIACVASPPLAMLWRAILIPFVLAGTVLHFGSAVGKVLELRTVRWVGRISYSLYLWQQVCLVPHGLARPFGILQSFPVNLVVLFLCAALSYYLIERPLIRFGRLVEAWTLESPLVVEGTPVRQAGSIGL